MGMMERSFLERAVPIAENMGLLVVRQVADTTGMGSGYGMLRAMDPRQERTVPYRHEGIAPGVVMEGDSERATMWGGLFSRHCSNTAIQGDSVTTNLASQKDPNQTIADLAQACVDHSRFTNAVAQMGACLRFAPPADPQTWVSNACARLSLTIRERDSILRYLIGANDLTAYGLQAAITRTAQDAPTLTRQQQLERLGGQLVAEANPEILRGLTAPENLRESEIVRRYAEQMRWLRLDPMRGPPPDYPGTEVLERLRQSYLREVADNHAMSRQVFVPISRQQVQRALSQMAPVFEEIEEI